MLAHKIGFNIQAGNTERVAAQKLDKVPVGKRPIESGVESDEDRPGVLGRGFNPRFKTGHGPGRFLAFVFEFFQGQTINLKRLFNKIFV